MLRIKRIILFFLSPLFALAYMAIMPVAGLVSMLRGRDPRLD